MSAMDRWMNHPWRLWAGQVAGVVRMELRKGFMTKRSLWIYLVAFAPVAIVFLHTIFAGRHSVSGDTEVMAVIAEIYYVRLGIFFGCLGVFTWLFRGEMIERTFHYYLLTPLRRELIVIGKFVAGTVATSALFGLAVLLCYFFMYCHGPEFRAFALSPTGLQHLVGYLGVTVLGCIGYGALFLALSMIFRNPIVPGLVVLGWESLNPILPALLQKLSVIFYLRNLMPVSVQSEGIFVLLTVVADPVPTPIAVGGALAITAAILAFACVRMRSVEISYTTE